jgi:UPF0716 family protein affecting phage T7 exclusion
MLLGMGWIIPVVIVGSFLGYPLHKRISTGLFEKLILSLCAGCQHPSDFLYLIRRTLTAHIFLDIDLAF